MALKHSCIFVFLNYTTFIYIFLIRFDPLNLLNPCPLIKGRTGRRARSYSLYLPPLPGQTKIEGTSLPDFAFNSYFSPKHFHQFL